MFIKNRTKHASKDGIELAVFVAFGEVLSFGLGVAELVLVLLLTVRLVDGFSFVHSVVYSAHKHTINTPENENLSLSSNRKHMKYRAWSDIFGCASNGMVKTILRETW